MPRWKIEAKLTDYGRFAMRDLESGEHSRQSDWHEVKQVYGSSEADALTKAPAELRASQTSYELRATMLAEKQRGGSGNLEHLPDEVETILAVPVPVSLRKALRRLAVERDMSIKALVVAALKNYLMEVEHE